MTWFVNMSQKSSKARVAEAFLIHEKKNFGTDDKGFSAFNIVSGRYMQVLLWDCNGILYQNYFLNSKRKSILKLLENTLVLSMIRRFKIMIEF